MNISFNSIWFLDILCYIEIICMQLHKMQIYIIDVLSYKEDSVIKE